MPNTLVHLGINGIATRTIIRNADLKWIYMGAIIPDFPWIMQRIIKQVIPGVNLYDLRLYCVIQASFIFCLLISFALSSFSEQYKKTCLILSVGSLLHLLLDALQTKWANGVHLIVPFDWQILNFGLFWPESNVTYLLTVFGLIYFLVNIRKAISMPWRISFKLDKRRILGVILLAGYLVLPLNILNDSELANNHFVKTLREYNNRQDKYIELDRGEYEFLPENSHIYTFTGEKLNLSGLNLERDAKLSIKGVFISNDVIRINQYHIHHADIREIASYIGLSLVALMWIWIAANKNNGK